MEDKFFNKAAIGGPNLDDISVFNKYVQPRYQYQVAFENSGLTPEEFWLDNEYDKTVWWIKPDGMDTFDTEAFNTQILRRLQGKPKDDSYTYMTQQ